MTDREERGFLRRTRENPALNQYWYSARTVLALCGAVREVLARSDERRAAFLSTPSLYFSLTPRERARCALFDVSADRRAPRLWRCARAFPLAPVVGSHPPRPPPRRCALPIPYPQFDTSWESCAGFHLYDYNDPTAVADRCRGAFDVIVMDPPFISPAVWENYAATARLLARNGDAWIIATTVDENAALMQHLFGCTPAAFRPSIPSLVYQYSVFTNFASSTLSAKNPELLEETTTPTE